MAWGKESSVTQSDGLSEQLAVQPRSREVHARTQTGRGTVPEKQVEADVTGDIPWAGDCKLSLEGSRAVQHRQSLISGKGLAGQCAGQGHLLIYSHCSLSQGKCSRISLCEGKA